MSVAVVTGSGGLVGSEAATYFAGLGLDVVGIDNDMRGRLFGPEASTVAADVMVQEYGRYYGIRTACFRGGTLTGPLLSATQLHGFLAYVMRCVMTGTPYTLF